MNFNYVLSEIFIEKEVTGGWVLSQYYIFILIILLD